jgi:hypothetical protein
MTTKLHLGCGADYWDGYINVDSDHESKADLKVDYMSIGNYFPIHSIDEVTIIQAINYITLWQARDLLAILHKIIIPGGLLVIETIDIERCIEFISDNIRNDFDGYLEGVRGFIGFGIDNLIERRPYTGNLFNWSYWHLSEELFYSGFLNIKRMEPRYHNPKRDMRIEAVNG